MRGVRGVRVSAEMVNCVAVGDWMGDPDVTLGLGRGDLWDGEEDVVSAGSRGLGMEEIEPGEGGSLGDCAGNSAHTANPETE